MVGGHEESCGDEDDEDWLEDEDDEDWLEDEDDWLPFSGLLNLLELELLWYELEKVGRICLELELELESETGLELDDDRDVTGGSADEVAEYDEDAPAEYLKPPLFG